MLHTHRQHRLIPADGAFVEGVAIRALRFGATPEAGLANAVTGRHRTLLRAVGYTALGLGGRTGLPALLLRLGHAVGARSAGWGDGGVRESRYFY